MIRIESTLLMALILLLVMPLVLQAAESTRPELTLRVAVTAGFHGSAVRLSDVAEAIGEDRDLWAQIKDIVVSRSDGRWVTRSKIQKRLESAGVPRSSVRIEGAAICTLDPQADPGNAGPEDTREE